MKKFQNLFYFLLTTIFLPLHIFASETQNSNGPLIRIVTEDAFPLNYLDPENKEIKGGASDIIKAIMDDTGLKYTLNLLPWTRAYKEAQNNENVLIYSIGRTPDREKKFKWIGEILPIKYNIYGLAKFQSSKPTTIKMIKKRSIGITRNGMMHNYLQQNGFTNLVFVNSYEHSVKLLQRGRIDYFVASSWGIKQFKTKFNLKNTDIVPIHDFADLTAGLYFAFSLQTSDVLVGRVKDSFARIVENGTFTKFMKPILEKQ